MKWLTLNVSNTATASTMLVHVKILGHVSCESCSTCWRSCFVVSDYLINTLSSHCTLDKHTIDTLHTPQVRDNEQNGRRWRGGGQGGERPPTFLKEMLGAPVDHRKKPYLLSKRGVQPFLQRKWRYQSNKRAPDVSMESICCFYGQNMK